MESGAACDMISQHHCRTLLLAYGKRIMRILTPAADTVVVDEVNARVRAYVRRHALIAAGDTVVVAVSGGADSLCLLHVLQALAPDLGCGLHVAHLDHALRPTYPADAAFVAAPAAELGVSCSAERRDVGALARTQPV